MTHRILLPASLALAVGCVPELPASEDLPAEVVLDHDFEASDTTRVGAWQVDLNDMSFVAERHSEALPAPGDVVTVPFMPADYDLSMGSLGALTGDSVLLFLAVYDDQDDSGSHDVGEPVLGLSQTALIRVHEGAWYTLDFGPSLSPVFGELEDGASFMDFTDPASLTLEGGFDATMPPNDALPLPPANRASVLSPIEPEAYRMYVEAGHPEPPPLPGRPADEAADLAEGSWFLDLPADPGPAFFAARFTTIEGLGTLAIEAPVAFLDNGDETFVPDFSGAPPEFDQTGTPAKDLLLGQVCLDESQLLALYVSTPASFDEALVTWALWGGQTGWHGVTGLAEGAPTPVSPKRLLELDFTTSACAPDAE